MRYSIHLTNEKNKSKGSQHDRYSMETHGDRMVSTIFVLRLRLVSAGGDIKVNRLVRFVPFFSVINMVTLFLIVRVDETCPNKDTGW